MKRSVSLLVGMGFLFLGGTLVDADDKTRNRQTGRAIATAQVAKPKTHQLQIIYKTTSGQLLEKKVETIGANQKVTRTAKNFSGFKVSSPTSQTMTMTQNQAMTFVYQKQATPAQVQAEISAQVMSNINQYRKSKGLNTIRGQQQIQQAANQRAKELFTSFSHTRPNGRSGLSSPADYGYKGISFVENLGYTYQNQTLEWYRANGAQRIMNGWKNSAGHNKNLLNRQPTEGAVGISFRQVGPDRYDMTFSYIGGLQKSEYKK